MSKNLVTDSDTTIFVPHLKGTTETVKHECMGLLKIKFLAITNDYFTESAILAHGNYVILKVNIVHDYQY